jgi:flagellin-specific chaperone FliS
MERDGDKVGHVIALLADLREAWATLAAGAAAPAPTAAVSHSA